MSDFAGTFPGSFDAKKGRISVPAAFRSTLARLGAEEIILRSSRFFPCLEVWPKPDYMAEFDRRTEGLSKLSAEYQAISRKLLGRVHTLRPDAEGRVVMPAPLAEKAGLDGELQFAGRGAFFEIWNAATFAEEEAKLDALDDGGDV
ncbi:cell division/cell wall cluster transcriptional repressor MraZ [Siccirubricoccus sp. KC 17139]|uniref:Transcriptional regulator MraZ n=1 Tax=Siccirubricoccus soli TaxID=2899147 RepID=A0ABT1DBT3_9PROT|nr:cell division/cell wall cluster transcriptional repressor MraZ [Siccirubricoccus soli]MCO6419403.1 cell division/cell wall cluster transcriptional repressor MraZ [Siccirubricoccus soli]MCP2685538.1 cell division/cell wall cluster transcriptional repressor MraZ [Siccirubricoccus soli]